MNSTQSHRGEHKHFGRHWSERQKGSSLHGGPGPGVLSEAKADAGEFWFALNETFS